MRIDRAHLYRLLGALAEKNIAPTVFLRLAEAAPPLGRGALVVERQHRDLALRPSFVVGAETTASAVDDELRLYDERMSLLGYKIRYVTHTVAALLGGYRHTTQWRLCHRLHRDFDMPAKTTAISDGVLSSQWYKFDRLHRDGDKPAVTTTNGDMEWYRAGVHHRGYDRPAIVYRNGRREWIVAGRRHRDGDQPAIVSANGDRRWFRYGKHYRADDLPTYESRAGEKRWMTGSGELHRDNDLPAVIKADGTCTWYQIGLRHRLNGPAVENKTTGHREWYYNGQLATRAWIATRRNIMGLPPLADDS